MRNSRRFIPWIPTITQGVRAEYIFLNEALPFYNIVEHNILVIGGITGTGITASGWMFKIYLAKKKCFQLTDSIYHPEGKFVPLGAETNEDVFGQQHDGRFGHRIWSSTF